MVRAFAGDSTITRFRPPAARAGRGRGGFPAAAATAAAGAFLATVPTGTFLAFAARGALAAAGAFAAAGALAAAGAFAFFFLAGLNRTTSMDLCGIGGIGIDAVLVVEPADQDRRGQL